MTVFFELLVMEKLAFSFHKLFRLSYLPSGLANSITLTEVKNGCVWSETGWAAFQMNNQNSSLRHLSKGTLCQGSHAWMQHDSRPKLAEKLGVAAYSK